MLCVHTILTIHFMLFGYTQTWCSRSFVPLHACSRHLTCTSRVLAFTVKIIFFGNKETFFTHNTHFLSTPYPQTPSTRKTPMSFNVVLPSNGFGNAPYVVGSSQSTQSTALPIVEICNAGADKAAIWTTLQAKQMIFRLELQAVNGDFLTEPEFRIQTSLVEFEADGFVLASPDASGNSSIKHAGDSFNKTVTYGFDIEERFTGFSQRVYATRQAQLDPSKFLTVGDLKHEDGKQGTKSSALTQAGAFSGMEIYACTNNGGSAVASTVVYVPPGKEDSALTLNGGLGTVDDADDLGAFAGEVQARLEAGKASLNVATVTNETLSIDSIAQEYPADVVSIALEDVPYPLAEADKVDVTDVSINATAATAVIDVADPPDSDAAAAMQKLTFSTHSADVTSASATLTMNDGAYGSVAIRENQFVELSQAQLSAPNSLVKTYDFPAASYPTTTMTLTVTVESGASDTIVIPHTINEDFTSYTFSGTGNDTFGGITLTFTNEGDNGRRMILTGTAGTSYTIQASEALAFTTGVGTGGYVTSYNGPTTAAFTYSGTRVGFTYVPHPESSYYRSRIRKSSSLAVSEAVYNQVSEGDVLKRAGKTDRPIKKKWSSGGGYYLYIPNLDSSLSVTSNKTIQYLQNSDLAGYAAAGFNVSTNLTAGNNKGTWFNVPDINESYFYQRFGVESQPNYAPLTHSFILANENVTFEKKNFSFFANAPASDTDSAMGIETVFVKGTLQLKVGGYINSDASAAVVADEGAAIVLQLAADFGTGANARKATFIPFLDGERDKSDTVAYATVNGTDLNHSEGNKVVIVKNKRNLGVISKTNGEALWDGGYSNTIPRESGWAIVIEKKLITGITSPNDANTVSYNGADYDQYEIVAVQQIRAGVLIEGYADGSQAIMGAGSLPVTNAVLYDGRHVDYTVNGNPNNVVFDGTTTLSTSGAGPSAYAGEIVQQLNARTDLVCFQGTVTVYSNAARGFAVDATNGTSIRVLKKSGNFTATPDEGSGLSAKEGPAEFQTAGVEPLTVTVGDAEYTFNRGLTDTTASILAAMQTYFDDNAVAAKIAAGVTINTDGRTITFETGSKLSNTTITVSAGSEMFEGYTDPITLEPTAGVPATVQLKIGDTDVWGPKTYNEAPLKDGTSVNFTTRNDMAASFLNFAEGLDLIDESSAHQNNGIVSLPLPSIVENYGFTAGATYDVNFATNGSGTGAQATMIVGADGIVTTNIVVTNSGSGYAAGDQVSATLGGKDVVIILAANDIADVVTLKGQSQFTGTADDKGFTVTEDIDDKYVIALGAYTAPVAATTDETYTITVTDANGANETSETVVYGHSGVANSASTRQDLADLLAGKGFGAMVSSAAAAGVAVTLTGRANGQQFTVTIAGGGRVTIGGGTSSTTTNGVYGYHLFTADAADHSLFVDDIAVLTDSTANDGNWTVTERVSATQFKATNAGALTDATVNGSVYSGTAKSVVVRMDADGASSDAVTVALDSSKTRAAVVTALKTQLDSLKAEFAASITEENGTTITLTSLIPQLKLKIVADPLNLFALTEYSTAGSVDDKMTITSASHGLVVGDVVSIEDATNSANNQVNKVVLYKDANRFALEAGAADSVAQAGAGGSIVILNKIKLTAINNGTAIGAVGGGLTLVSAPFNYQPAKLRNLVTERLSGVTLTDGTLVRQVSEDDTEQELARGTVETNQIGNIQGHFEIGDAAFKLQSSANDGSTWADLNKTGADLSLSPGGINTPIEGATREMFRTLVDGVEMTESGTFEVGQYYVKNSGPQILKAVISGTDAAEFGFNDASKKYNLLFQGGGLSVNTGTATPADALVATVTFSMDSNLMKDMELATGVAKVVNNTITIDGITNGAANLVNWGYYSADTITKTLQGNVQRSGANIDKYTIQHQLGDKRNGTGTFTLSDTDMDWESAGQVYGSVAFAQKSGSEHEVDMTLTFTDPDGALTVPSALDSTDVLRFTLKFTPTDDQGVELSDPSLVEYVYYTFRDFEKPYSMDANDLDYATLDTWRVLHNADNDTVLSNPKFSGETYEDTNFYCTSRSNAQILDLPGLEWTHATNQYTATIDKAAATHSTQITAHGRKGDDILTALRALHNSQSNDFTVAVVVDFLAPAILGGYTRTDGTSQTFHNSDILFSTEDTNDSQKHKIHQLNVAVAEDTITLKIKADDASQTALHQIDSTGYPDNLGDNRAQPFGTASITGKITQFVCVEDIKDLAGLGVADSVSNAGFLGVTSGNFQAKKKDTSSGNDVEMEIVYQKPASYALTNNADGGAGNFMFYRKTLNGLGVNVLRMSSADMSGVCARVVSLYNPDPVDVIWSATSLVKSVPSEDAVIGQLYLDSDNSIKLENMKNNNNIPAGLYVYLDMDNVGSVRRDLVTGKIKLTRSAEEMPTQITVKVSNSQRGNGFAVDSNDTLTELGLTYTEDPLQSLHVLKKTVNAFRLVIDGGDYGTGQLSLPSVAGMTQVVIDGSVVLHAGATLAFDANTDVVLVEKENRTITVGGIVRTSNELLGSIESPNSGFTTGTYYVGGVEAPLTTTSGSGAGAKAKIVVSDDGAVTAIDVYEHGSAYAAGSTVSATLGAKDVVITLVADDIADIYPGDMSGIVENGGSVTFAGAAVMRTHKDYRLTRGADAHVLGMVCGTTTSPTKRFYINREVVSLAVNTGGRHADAKIFVPCRMGSWTAQAAANLSIDRRLTDAIRLPATLLDDLVVGDVVLVEGNCDLGGKKLVVGPSARIVAHRSLAETLAGTAPTSQLTASANSTLQVEGASETDAAEMDGIAVVAAGDPVLQFRHAKIGLRADQGVAFDTNNVQAYIDRCDFSGPASGNVAKVQFGARLDSRTARLEARKIRLLNKIHAEISASTLLLQDFDLMSADAKVNFKFYGATVRKMRMTASSDPFLNASNPSIASGGTFDQKMFQGLASPNVFENDIVLYKGGANFNALARACAEKVAKDNGVTLTASLALSDAQKTTARTAYDSVKGAMGAAAIADNDAFAAAITLGAGEYYLRCGQTFDKDVDQLVDSGVEHFAGHMIFQGELLSNVRLTKDGSNNLIIITEKVRLTGTLDETTATMAAPKILVNDVVLADGVTVTSTSTDHTESNEAYAAAPAQEPNFLLHDSGVLGTPSKKRVLISGASAAINAALTGSELAPYILQPALGQLDKGAYALTRTAGKHLKYVGIFGSQGCPGLTANDEHVAILHTMGNGVAGSTCKNVYIEDCTGHAMGAGSIVNTRVECVDYGERLCNGTLNQNNGKVYAETTHRPRGNASQFAGTVSVQAPFQAKFDLPTGSSFEAVDDASRLRHWWNPMAPFESAAKLKGVSTNTADTITYGFLKSSEVPVGGAGNTLTAAEIGSSKTYTLKKTAANATLPKAVFGTGINIELATNEDAAVAPGTNDAMTEEQLYRTARTASGDTVSLSTLEALNLPAGWDASRYNIDCTSHASYDVLLLPPHDNEESASVTFSKAKEIEIGTYIFQRAQHAFSSAATNQHNQGVFSAPPRREQAFVSDTLTVTVDPQPYLELSVGGSVLTGDTRTRILRASQLDLGVAGPIKAIAKCTVQDQTVGPGGLPPTVAFTAATAKFAFTYWASIPKIVSMAGEHGTASSAGDTLVLRLEDTDTVYDGANNELTVQNVMESELPDSKYGTQSLIVKSVTDLTNVAIASTVLENRVHTVCRDRWYALPEALRTLKNVELTPGVRPLASHVLPRYTITSSMTEETAQLASFIGNFTWTQDSSATDKYAGTLSLPAKSQTLSGTIGSDKTFDKTTIIDGIVNINGNVTVSAGTQILFKTNAELIISDTLTVNATSDANRLKYPVMVRHEDDHTLQFCGGEYKGITCGTAAIKNLMIVGGTNQLTVNTAGSLGGTDVQDGIRLFNASGTALTVGGTTSAENVYVRDAVEAVKVSAGATAASLKNCRIDDCLNTALHMSGNCTIENLFVNAAAEPRDAENNESTLMGNGTATASGDLHVKPGARKLGSITGLTLVENDASTVASALAGADINNPPRDQNAVADRMATLSAMGYVPGAGLNSKATVHYTETYDQFYNDDALTTLSDTVVTQSADCTVQTADYMTALKFSTDKIGAKRNGAGKVETAATVSKDATLNWDGDLAARSIFSGKKSTTAASAPKSIVRAAVGLGALTPSGNAFDLNNITATAGQTDLVRLQAKAVNNAAASDAITKSGSYSAFCTLGVYDTMPDFRVLTAGAGTETAVNSRHTWLLGGVDVTGTGACAKKSWLTLNNVTNIKYDMEVKQGDATAQAATVTFNFKNPNYDAGNKILTINGASKSRSDVNGYLPNNLAAIINDLSDFTASHSDNISPYFLTITGPADGSAFTFQLNPALVDCIDSVEVGGETISPTTNLTTATGTPGAPTGRVYGIDGLKILVGESTGAFAASAVAVTVGGTYSKTCSLVEADNRLATSASPSMALSSLGVLASTGLSDPKTLAYQMQNEAFFSIYDAHPFGIATVRHASHEFGSTAADITSAASYLDVTPASQANNGVIDIALKSSVTISGDSTPVFLNINGYTMPNALTIDGADIALNKVGITGVDQVQGAIRPSIHPRLSDVQVGLSTARDYSYLPGTFSLKAPSGTAVADVVLSPSLGTQTLQQANANQSQQFLDYYQVFGNPKINYIGVEPNDGHILEFLRGPVGTEASQPENLTLAISGTTMTLSGSAKSFEVGDFIECSGFANAGNNGRFQLTQVTPSVTFENAGVGETKTATVQVVKDIGLKIDSGVLKTNTTFNTNIALRPSVRYKAAFGNNNANGGFEFTTDLFPQIFKDPQSGTVPGTVHMLDGLGSAPDMGVAYAPLEQILDQHASYVGPFGGSCLVQLTGVTSWSETMTQAPRLFKIPAVHGTASQIVGNAGTLRVEGTTSTGFTAKIVTSCCIYVKDAVSSDYTMETATAAHGSTPVGVLKKSDGTEVLRVGDTITQGSGSGSASATVSKIVVSGQNIQIEVGANADFVSGSTSSGAPLQKGGYNIFVDGNDVSWEVHTSTYSGAQPIPTNNYVLFVSTTIASKYGLLKVTGWSTNTLTLAVSDQFNETVPTVAQDDALRYMNIGSDVNKAGDATFKSAHKDADSSPNAFKLARTGSALKPDKMVILGLATHGMKTNSPGVYVPEANEYMLLMRVDNASVNSGQKYQYRVVYISTGLTNPYTLMRTTTVGGVSNNLLSNVIRGVQTSPVAGVTTRAYESVERNVGNIDLEGSSPNNPSHWGSITRAEDLSGVLIVNHDETTEHGHPYLQSQDAVFGTLAQLKRPSIAAASVAGNGTTVTFTFTTGLDVPAEGKVVLSLPSSFGGQADPNVAAPVVEITGARTAGQEQTINVTNVALGANGTSGFGIYTEDASGTILESSIDLSITIT